MAPVAAAAATEEKEKAEGRAEKNGNRREQKWREERETGKKEVEDSRSLRVRGRKCREDYIGGGER